jgi:hypothetical protein
MRKPSGLTAADRAVQLAAWNALWAKLLQPLPTVDTQHGAAGETLAGDPSSAAKEAPDDGSPSNRSTEPAAWSARYWTLRAAACAVDAFQRRDARRKWLARDVVRLAQVLAASEQRCTKPYFRRSEVRP